MNNQAIMNNQQMMQQPQMNPMQLAMMQQYAANMQNNPNNPNGGSLVNKLFAGSSIISGPTEGTSIASLKKGNNTNQHKNTMQQQFGKGGYPPQRYPQQNPQGYTMHNNTDDQHEAVPSESDIERDGIRHLVKDINRGLGDYGPSDIQNTDTEETVDNDDEPKKSDFTLFGLIKEPLIILLLYLLISQNFVKNGLGAYITQVLPRHDGSTSFLGHLICGIIIASLFVLSKKILV